MCSMVCLISVYYDCRDLFQMFRLEGVSVQNWAIQLMHYLVGATAVDADVPDRVL